MNLIARRIGVLSVLCASWICIPVLGQVGTEQIPVETQLIWNAEPHNAFTDLIRWNDKFYCCFRVGTGHVPGNSGQDGQIRVVSSVDGQAWKPVALIAEDGIDLRDPKLSEMPDGRLMLLMGGSDYDGSERLGCAARVAFLEKEDASFSEITPVVIDSNIVSENDWLWRVTWHQGVGYGIVYQAEDVPWGLHLVQTRDGINYRRIKTFSMKGKPNESTIRFDKQGAMHVIVRNEDERRIGHYGLSQPPYDQWNWNRIETRLGGPNFVQLPAGDWILGTRDYQQDPKTTLGFVTSDGEFKKAVTFPSGGDTSYPGMVVHDGWLWVSYYASHEGKSSIYLAKVKLSDLGNRSGSLPDGTVVYRRRPIPPEVPREGHGSEAKQYGYRIPSLLVTRQGSVLAFSERRLGLHDHAQNDIVVKRSVDDGETWGEEIVAYEDGMNSINDPLTVQLESGRILLMFARFPYGRHTRDSGWIKLADLGYDDPDSNVLTFLCHSDDDGLTWSQPKDISRQVKHPQLLNANTPGAMIQLKNGVHRGRVVTGLWGAQPVIKNGKRVPQWRAVVAFSDDQGESWKRTEPLQDVSGKGFLNECQIAEASNGDLVFVSRNQGGVTFRKKAISHDGGETWGPADIDPTLPSVACMGSVIRGPERQDGSWDLFASFPSDQGRFDGQIMVSRDHGASWQRVGLIPGPFAYSAMQVSPDQKNLFLLYESENYLTQTFLKLPLKELIQPGSDR